MWYRFKPYVPVAERRHQAARELAKLRKTKKGRAAAPVVVGRGIANTFWGQAWCRNLERYSDFENRLPRGRSYVRNGSVLDLHVAGGQVEAAVMGSRLYHVDVRISALAATRWRALRRDCAGAIDSLVELLQGRLSRAVMARVCEPGTGLFPESKEIQFTCSCPDWAAMCKHVAAVLYGIGARLDEQPELLFVLRGVDHTELVSVAGRGLSKAGGTPTPDRVLADDNLAELFGLDLGEQEVVPSAPVGRAGGARSGWVPNGRAGAMVTPGVGTRRGSGVRKPAAGESPRPGAARAGTRPAPTPRSETGLQRAKGARKRARARRD